MSKALTTVYDATVTPSHAAKLLPALAEQFAAQLKDGGVLTHYAMTAKGKSLESNRGANRVRIVIQVPA